MSFLQIKVRRVRENQDLPLPSYQTPQSAGMDLRADIPDGWVLKPLERIAVPTGLALEIPEGYEGQVRPRSGLALKQGVTCLNSPGTLDADFRGEVMVILINLSSSEVSLKRGDRIAQLILSPVVQVKCVEADELSSTIRGAGGFGSTGR